MIYPDFRTLAAARLGKTSSGNGVPLARFLGSNTPFAGPISRQRFDLEIERARSAGCDLLYSSEALLSIEPEKATDFIEFARNAGFDVKAVIYVRSVADYAISIYHQEVKMNRMTGSFSDFLQSFDARSLRWALSLYRVFGRDRMIVRNYDACKRNLIEDFFSNMLGFSSLEGFLLGNPLVNRSLTETELAIMRTMNFVLTKPRHSRMASNAFIDADRGAVYRHKIAAKDYQAIEAKFSSLVIDINACQLNVPIALKSDDLEIGPTADVKLSESEILLARLSAAVIEMVGAIRWPERDPL